MSAARKNSSLVRVAADVNFQAIGSDSEKAQYKVIDLVCLFCCNERSGQLRFASNTEIISAALFEVNFVDQNVKP